LLELAALALIRVPRSLLFLGIRICIDGKRVSYNSDHFRDGYWLGVPLFFLSALLVRLSKSPSYKLMADHPGARSERCAAACSDDKFILEMTT
jgi:hypothetical protein